MEKRVKEDILSILSGVIETLKVPEVKDIQELQEFSDHTLHDASIYQDEYAVEIAVLVYSLYKLLERGCQCTLTQYGSIVNNFEKAKTALEQDNIKLYEQSIQNIFQIIKNLDKKLKMYVQEVIDKARITKGSKLFAHGLSLSTAARIMGINQWELNNYVGKTTIIEQAQGGMSQHKRINKALQLFGL